MGVRYSGLKAMPAKVKHRRAAATENMMLDTVSRWPRGCWGDQGNRVPCLQTLHLLLHYAASLS